MKIDIFKTLIEPILLYGSETWTLTSKQQQRVDGTYIRLLMRVKNISWKRHPTKQQIYTVFSQICASLSNKRLPSYKCTPNDHFSISAPPLNKHSFKLLLQCLGLSNRLDGFNMLFCKLAFHKSAVFYCLCMHFWLFFFYSMCKLY